MKIIWSKEAKADLDSIYVFQATFNENAAVRIYNAILDEVEILLRFPNLAPMSCCLRINIHFVR